MYIILRQGSELIAVVLCCLDYFCLIYSNPAPIGYRWWTHHSSTAAAALATCAATHSLQVGEFRLSCTVWFGAGLPCRRLSAGWRLWTEISAICWATGLLCATAEQHVRRSILRGGWAACMEWAAVQSTWHCSIVDCLHCTHEGPFIFHLVRGHGALVTFMISLRRI